MSLLLRVPGLTIHDRGRNPENQRDIEIEPLFLLQESSEVVQVP